VLQPWLAALLVGALVSVFGAILISAGRRRIQVVHPAPEKTIRNVKENVQWLKDQTK
jgi:Putative Actinobacterial Holin-X, holin superfamily III